MCVGVECVRVCVFSVEREGGRAGALWVSVRSSVLERVGEGVDRGRDHD